MNDVIGEFCDTHPMTLLISSNNVMAFKFKTDGNSGKEKNGFKISYMAIGRLQSLPHTCSWHG